MSLPQLNTETISFPKFFINWCCTCMPLTVHLIGSGWMTAASEGEPPKLGVGANPRKHFKQHFNYTNQQKCTHLKVYEGPVITQTYVNMQERQKQRNYDWSSDISPFYIHYVYIWKICPPQVVILAFKVGWWIHGVTHALNNMQENVPLWKMHLSGSLNKIIFFFPPVKLNLWQGINMKK